MSTIRQETSTPSATSCIAVFADPLDGGEAGFERALWSVLQHLHDQHTSDWSDEVAADPSDPHFALSVSGTAFFVAGLHPAGTRIRAPVWGASRVHPSAGASAVPAYGTGGVGVGVAGRELMNTSMR